MGRKLSNKIAVITGAGSGIGRASAIRFAADGATVVVSDINGDSATATADLITDAGGDATAVTTDVTDAGEVSFLVTGAVQKYGRLDILYSNAGGQQPKPTLEVTPAAFANTVVLNLNSMYYGISAALPFMLEQKSGVFLSTTSGAGIGAVPGLAAYGAAKAGMISLTRSIAVEYGALGIRANVISPGSMDTPGLRQWLTTLPGGSEAYASQIPSGRLGTAEEIASVASFLVSDESAYINGTLVPVDGAAHSRLSIPRF
ncbi:SDR family NAD(P)-dependent oxidoreductase [Rhodococcus sp. IEGM 1379]|uniref:SDR family NAD(P)-dependent oxidoreductase n=1 Tax=Rhodococcus sp. IEGM 1379 TaxID=3047086 RepID=UPI0024B721D1|nr:SDR family NAD(P)-dependent oxidoreductase [Rhodococcus sp. IEGM 1379]MDI9914237.1 SDR family NAD(P)-dependent oxidoreductase [Rhodococcus sp. IEGM 1379]